MGHTPDAAADSTASSSPSSRTASTRHSSSARSVASHGQRRLGVLGQDHPEQVGGELLGSDGGASTPSSPGNARMYIAVCQLPFPVRR